jgi:hypothetical protein
MKFPLRKVCGLPQRSGFAAPYYQAGQLYKPGSVALDEMNSRLMQAA